jgi:hypothetical protein
MSHPARGPARSAGIDGKANGADGRRAKFRGSQPVVREAAR